MRIVFLIFFFLSGASGLIYEIVWTKLFALSMGGTTYAISTVLASFMFGLAAGSRYGGKYADKSKKPLLIYGAIEGIIGVYCLLIPLLVKLIPAILGPFYDGYYTSHPLMFGVLRFLLSASILFVPTFLMGASLPVLASYYASAKKNFGWEVGRLYAVNTLGAAVGAFSAGFYLLPNFGKTLSIGAAAAINIFICVIAIVLAKRQIGVETAVKKIDTGSNKIPGVASGTSITKTVFLASLLVYGINGFAGMAYQIAWTRALTLSIGSSAYSFSIIVTVFIVGLAFGGGIGARMSDRISNPATALAALEILIGFFAISAMFGLGRMPDVMFRLKSGMLNDWSGLVAMEFLSVAVLLILPTMTMGAVFPFAMRICGLYRKGVGEPVGLAYGINTLGAIGGCIIGGFIMIPALGLQKTITAINVLNWLGGAALLFAATAGTKTSKAIKSASPLLAGAILTLLVPPWNTSLMVSGPFLYNAPLSPDYKILFHKEDADSIVTVVQTSDTDLILRVNGKTDASTEIDMATQQLVGHLPILLHKNPKKVFILGLASGVTLGSVTRYSSVESVDMLEISKAIVKASDFFAPWNYMSRKDPRVNVIVDDGRNYLTMTKKKYDVIVSEPSNPWMSGVSNLFTAEYFDIVAKKLLPGGVFCIWLQGYSTSAEDFRLIMRTFQSEFPECSLWESSTGTDYILIGSKEPLNLNLEKLNADLSRKEVADDLKRSNINDVPELMAYFLMAKGRFKEAAGPGPIHRDDDLSLEYSAPKNLLTENPYPELYKQVLRFKEHPKTIMTPALENWPAELAAKLDNQVDARANYDAGMVYFVQGRKDLALEFLNAVMAQANNDEQYRTAYRTAVKSLSVGLWEQVKYKEAFELLDKALEVMPDEPMFYSLRASFYMSLRQGKPAYENFQKAVQLDPKDFISIFNMGFIELTALQEYELAEEHFKKANALNPRYVPALNALGNLATKGNRPEEAEKYFRAAIEIDPKYADAYLNLAMVLIEHKDEAKKREAISLYRKAVSMNPELEKDEKIRKIFSGEPE